MLEFFLLADGGPLVSSIVVTSRSTGDTTCVPAGLSRDAGGITDRLGENIRSRCFADPYNEPPVDDTNDGTNGRDAEGITTRSSRTDGTDRRSMPGVVINTPGAPCTLALAPRVGALSTTATSNFSSCTSS